MKLSKNLLKIVIFTAVKNCCILHGRVFVMSAGITTLSRRLDIAGFRNGALFNKTETNLERGLSDSINAQANLRSCQSQYSKIKVGHGDCT